MSALDLLAFSPPGWGAVLLHAVAFLQVLLPRYYL